MSPSARRWWKVLQAAFVIAVLWYGGVLLARQWGDLRSLGARIRPDWWRVAGSAGVVLVSYGVLIATWRAMVAQWAERLDTFTAMRIWFVSNLGRYVPGKVWQIGAMGVMAQDAGVSAVAAVGSSLVIALVNLLVGFAVVGATGAGLVAAVLPSRGALVVAVAALAVGVAALPWMLPPLMRFTLRVTGRSTSAATPHLPARVIWLAALGCGAAWVLYGIAFRELAVALLGSASGDVAAYVAVFTLSYLLGFLVLFAPGGIGVRELSMSSLLVAAGLAAGPEAALLVIASRLWLTVLEIVPGLLFLAWPRKSTRSRRGPHVALP
ncbi:MAG: lysylphosphatidylglycerol synthase domain-containing protein [Gemmatimonadaceae bacterium]